MEILKRLPYEKQKFTDMCGRNTLINLLPVQFLVLEYDYIVCKKPLNLKDVFELKL